MSKRRCQLVGVRPVFRLADDSNLMMLILQCLHRRLLHPQYYRVPFFFTVPVDIHDMTSTSVRLLVAMFVDQPSISIGF